MKKFFIAVIFIIFCSFINAENVNLVPKNGSLLTYSFKLRRAAYQGVENGLYEINGIIEKRTTVDLDGVNFQLKFITNTNSYIYKMGAYQSLIKMIENENISLKVCVNNDGYQIENIDELKNIIINKYNNCLMGLNVDLFIYMETFELINSLALYCNGYELDKSIEKNVDVTVPLLFQKIKFNWNYGLYESSINDKGFEIYSEFNASEKEMKKVSDFLDKIGFLTYGAYNSINKEKMGIYMEFYDAFDDNLNCEKSKYIVDIDLIRSRFVNEFICDKL